MAKGKNLKPRNVTKINVPCAFGGQASEVAIFVGNPEEKHHPIHFQSKFIQDTRGGVIPQSVIEALEKLQKLSIENGVPFEELCKYAIESLHGGSNENEQIASSEKEEEKSENNGEIPKSPEPNTTN